MITYDNIHLGTFIRRENRFIAYVEIEGKEEKVHVKNTGRCKELLVPGATVSLQHFDSTTRKTAWDLIAVDKQGFGWINMDSQIPNKVVGQWLAEPNLIANSPQLIKPEYIYGKSRIDFYVEEGERKILCEVKGCTLEVDGQGYFPDAPTDRGAKHLRELAGAIDAGYEAYLVYCIAMGGVESVLPNEKTDPGYAKALAEAKEAGVKVVHLQCEITPETIQYTKANLG